MELADEVASVCQDPCRICAALSRSAPSILTDEAALRLMEEAIQRGMAITELDLAPAGSPPSLHRRDEAA